MKLSFVPAPGRRNAVIRKASLRPAQNEDLSKAQEA